MSTTANRPYWWQRYIPRYGNWGGVGWSAGRWNNDPSMTDWSVAGVDAMDDLFKAHDRAYQSGGDRDQADRILVAALHTVEVTGLYGRVYRLGAIGLFTIMPHVRAFQQGGFMRAILWCCIVVCAAGCAFAAVPAITPAEFSSQAASPESHWIWSVLGSDAVFNAWLWLVSTAVAAVTAWRGWQNTRKEQALLCLRQGIKVVGDTWVRSVKQSREDGKLTEDERKRANREAIEAAILFARDEGFDLLKTLAKETLPALADSLLRRIKREGAASKTPLPESQPPLPDLQPSR